MKDQKVEIDSLKDFRFSPKWESEKKPSKNFKKKTESKKEIFVRKKYKNKTPNKYFLKFSIGHKVTEILKQKLRNTGISWSIEELAEEIISQEAYEITVAPRKDENSFYKVLHNSNVYTDIKEAVNDIIYGKEAKVTLTQKEIKKLDINFDHVLKYDKTGDIFPPKSCNYLLQLIDAYLFKNNLNVERDKFIDNLKKTNDEIDLNKIRTYTAYDNIFSIDGLTFTNLDNVIKEIKNESYKYIQNIKKVRFSAKLLKQNFNRLQLSAESYKKHTNIRNDLCNVITIISKKSKFVIFDREKRKYICAYDNQNIDVNSISDTCKSILKECTQQETNTIQSILELSKNLTISKSEILKEVKWMVKSGIIRQFSTGHIEVVIANKN